MFKMIGGDGQEYGPVTADQLREWLAENRANGQTMLLAEGATEWRPLGSFPEFAEALGAGPPPLTPPELPPPSQPGPEPWSTSAPQGAVGLRDYDLDVSLCLGRGWQLLRTHLPLLVGATTLVWLIVTLGSFTGCLGGLLSLLLAGALHGGLLLLNLRLIRGQAATVTDVFACFGPGFWQLMLIWIGTHLLSGLGMLLCLLPGIYLKVIWAFGLTLAADRGLEFWPALEASRRGVSRHGFKIAALLGIAFLPLIVFSVYSAVETAPHSMALVKEFFATWRLESVQDQLNELGRFTSRLQKIESLVLLLNLPFANAALMHAYEAAFGVPRR